MSKDAIVSARLDGDLHERLRQQARAAGVSVSDLLRAFARRLVAPSDGLEELAEKQQPYTFRCEHMSISGAGLRSARCIWCAP